MRKPAALLLVSFLITSSALAQQAVSIDIDAARIAGELNPIYRYFGYDECNFTYMKDGQRLLTEISRISPGPIFIRCHHLFTSGDGSPGMKWGSTNVYHEDAQGNPVYDWTITDKIFDTYVERGLKPYVQLGFMPKDLSTHPELYPTDIAPDKRIAVDAGQAYPPKDYGKWGELCYQFAKHCLERYGQSEVDGWYWEVWNEPNISYWKGTPAEYYKLYDSAVDGVRRALPHARVGGNESAGSERSVKAFLEHCRDNRSPLDFVSFHAKGEPEFVDGHVRTGPAAQLQVIERNFKVIASFPEYKDKPIVIGESDPDGMAARPVSEAPQLGYRNTTLFSSYTAATIAREYDLADKYGVNLEGALTWSFEFENKPYFAGYRTLSTNGVDLPVFNVFRMYGKMGGKRLAVRSSGDHGLREIVDHGVRAEPDIYALAGLEEKKLSIMAWHYHDDDVPGPAADAAISLSHLPISGSVKLSHYRIDADHSNSFTVWKKMGSPQTPTPEQYQDLVRAGQLQQLNEPTMIDVQEGATSIPLQLPRQAVSLLVLEWK
jgi:xylan 1,4-beta-xylosidase